MSSHFVSVQVLFLNLSEKKVELFLKWRKQELKRGFLLKSAYFVSFTFAQNGLKLSRMLFFHSRCVFLSSKISPPNHLPPPPGPPPIPRVSPSSSLSTATTISFLIFLKKLFEPNGLILGSSYHLIHPPPGALCSGSLQRRPNLHFVNGNRITLLFYLVGCYCRCLALVRIGPYRRAVATGSIKISINTIFDSCL